MDSINSYDILIVGGAHIGLSCALGLAIYNPDLKIAILERRSEEATKIDSRTVSLSQGSVNLLKQLDCWEAIADLAQPINKMVLTDSQLLDPVRLPFLTFTKESNNGHPIAYMIENSIIIKQLLNCLAKFKVDRIYGAAVQSLQNNAHKLAVNLADGSTYETKLLIGADGKFSKIRELLNIGMVEYPYKQSAIICKLSHSRSHNATAIQHFLPAGPFAVLPLLGNKSAIVWSEDSCRAEKLIKSDPELFKIELMRRLGYQLGEVTLLEPPKAFPLHLILAKEFIAPNAVILGDAAHGFHPIAGQGMNYGFYDVAALIEEIVMARRLGLDISDFTILTRYQIKRRSDAYSLGAVTHMLNLIFSNDAGWLRRSRSVGLGLVNKASYIKNYLMKDMAKIHPSAPSLLLDKAI